MLTHKCVAIVHQMQSPETNCAAEEDSVDAAEPLLVDDTDYLKLFWSGKDTLHLSQSLNQASAAVASGTDVCSAIGGDSNTDIDTKLTEGRLVKKQKLKFYPQKKPPPPPVRVLPPLLNRRDKLPRKLTESEIKEKMDLLSRPMVDKTEEDVCAPPLCSEGPQLSSSCVDELHEHSVPGCFEFEGIPGAVSTLMLQVEALTGEGEDIEMTSRLAVPDVSFTRKDSFYADNNTTFAESIEMVHSALLSKLDYRKIPKHVMEYNGFMHRYCLSFMCVVFDLRMQVIGTYDLFYGVFIPGISICPPKIRNQSIETCNKRASLLQIDLELLPRNVFAVLPILYDQTGHTLPDIALACSLSGCDNLCRDWSPVSERMRTFIGIRKGEASAENKSKDIPGNVVFKSVSSAVREFLPRINCV